MRPTRGPGAGSPHDAPLFGLAPRGVYRAASGYPVTRCALTAPFHPYRSAEAEVGGLFSVALSLGSPPPGVTRHAALWSSDFPPRYETAAATSPAPTCGSYHAPRPPVMPPGWRATAAGARPGGRSSGCIPGCLRHRRQHLCHRQVQHATPVLLGTADGTVPAAGPAREIGQFNHHMPFSPGREPQ